MKRILAFLIDSLPAICGLFLLASGVAQAGSPTIHPTYQWHTFIGGDSTIGETVPASTMDASGNLYIAGTTWDPWDLLGNPIGNPTAVNEGYVTKIDPAGQIVWNCYFLGVDPYGRTWIPNGVTPTAITLDKYGNVWVAGAGIVDSNANTDAASFVAEVDAGGSYLGGLNFGYARCSGGLCAQNAVYGLTYDPVQDWVYVTGLASLWWRGGQPVNSLPSAYAMFILQAGSGAGGPGLGWVGFYASGAAGNTWGQAITVDASSNLYVAGTDGNQGAVWKVSTANPKNPAWEMMNGNATIGKALTLYNGNLYVTGITTTGWNGPEGQPPINPFILTWGYGYDGTAFVMSLDTNGNFRWHTFYNGANKPVWGNGIAVGPTGVYVAGPGDLVGFNNAAPQNAGTPGAGHFVLQLSTSGHYAWHSLYGINRYDEANTVTLDPLQNIYVAGWSGYGSWNGDNNTLPLHPGNSDASTISIMKYAPPSVGSFSNCDILLQGSTNVTDVQTVINEVLGVAPAVDDLSHDGVLNIVDLQIVVNASVTGICPAS